ncbi:hypothetical protein GCM10022252_08670 [Streptosporangium oxazolinicum]|uniref:Uncharacterized protein n=1 Tax=Streptosporangium oxazolinicum TaxID=909287 RepID=A0ABP8AER4_9ACTN
MRQDALRLGQRGTLTEGWGAEQCGRLDDSRRTLGAQFLDAIELLIKQLGKDEKEPLADAIHSFFGFETKIDGLYGDRRTHRRFTLWLREEVSRLNP